MKRLTYPAPRAGGAETKAHRTCLQRDAGNPRRKEEVGASAFYQVVTAPFLVTNQWCFFQSFQPSSVVLHHHPNQAY